MDYVKHPISNPTQLKCSVNERGYYYPDLPLHVKFKGVVRSWQPAT